MFLQARGRMPRCRIPGELQLAVANVAIAQLVNQANYLVGVLVVGKEKGWLQPL